MYLHQTVELLIMNKLSVIIPAYNCAKTINRCINSILNQSEKINYEIILVDDGSNDGTDQIIDEYASKNKNIIALHQKNKGAGAARNYALQSANGDYLLFVDADDYIAQNCFAVINESLKNSEIDMLFFMYRYFDESIHKFKNMSNRDKQIYCEENIPNGIFTFSDYPKLLEGITYPWNKVFNASFIKRLGIKFSETIVHNDIFFNIASISSAARIKCIQDILYIHYINNIDGQLTQIFDERRLNAIKVLQECDAFLATKKLNFIEALPYIAFKFNLIDWVLNKAEGSLREHFLQYLDHELANTHPGLLLKLLGHRMCTGSLSRYMEKKGYPSSGSYYGENNEKLLSIIVPVFNVEPYLAKCLQSIADQTLNPKNFEVIIVDDKSTDNSLVIAKNFAKKYSNFRIIELPQNTPGGAGIPSNVGIKEAKGTYIGFVDSDDYIDNEMFEKLLLNAVKNDSDVTVCDFNVFYQKENKLVESYDKKDWKDFVKSITEEKSLRDIKTKLLAISAVPWRKLYKTNFLKKNTIYYPEGDYFFEDNPLHWFVTIHANKISVVDESLITHRIGRVGQTMEGKPERLIAFAEHAKTIKEFLDEQNQLQEYSIEFLKWYMGQTAWVLPKLGDKRRAYLNVMKSLCREFTFEDLKNFRKQKPFKIGTLYYYYYLMKGCYFKAIYSRRFINLINKVSLHFKK